MERLVTTAQASQILGLSLQGVHYRIKQDQLKSLKRNGKTYVYISDYLQEQIKNEEEKSSDIDKILEVKNEQIVLLKESMSWMKKQYKEEITRLEKNQKRIIKVFNSEINLLQNAFNEMRSIYKNENKQLENFESDFSFITVKDFFILMKKRKKTDSEIKNIILKCIQNNDRRFLFNKKTKELMIFNNDFSDLF